MATTTNYAWETPDDTDLVKDGAAAIRTLGSSIDTTTKALNPSTTLGDIEYRSSTANTNTRLAIGTTGQVLTVSGGVPAWSTPGGSSGPAFKAYRATSNQSFSSATWTKIQFNAENFDSDNCFDSTTNYRFTPNKAGYYQMNATIEAVQGSNGNIYVAWYKNGSNDGTWGRLDAFTNFLNSGANLFSMNGTTDYIEMYVYASSSSPYVATIASMISGVWIRSN